MHKHLLIVFSALLLAVSIPLGCTSENGEDGDQWEFEGDAGQDGSGEDATSDDDATGDDAVSEDTTGGEDVDDSDAPAGDAGPDAADGGNEPPEFEESSLVGTNWYGVFRLAENDGITGSLFEVTLLADNDVEIGAFGEVTGKWEVFDASRLRLYDLERDGEPNQPEQFAFDVDTDDQDRVLGLELFIPEGPSGDPYTMRLEQLGDTNVPTSELDGDWQSEEVFTDQNGNDNRLAVRFFGTRMGYGFYNGAYVEFVSGSAETLTYDGGKTFWLLRPPEDGPQRPAFGGEVQAGADGGFTIFAPRQTNPGEQPAEFSSEPLMNVPAFDL
ncbi:MAG: hypothetical protein ACQEVA_05665 [Myxococcota bacterium]